MAYVFKLPQTVTEEIMRYAIGYPCDRLCAIAADVVRTETHLQGREYVVNWGGPSLGDNRVLGRFANVTTGLYPGLRTEYGYLERRREVEMELLQEQCEPCEPTELELQRMYF